MVTSNLLRTYCKSHPHCDEEEGVKELMRSLESKALNYCDAGQSEDLDKVGYFLKNFNGIQNARRFHSLLVLNAT